ncbi:hypothetical protein [Streptomyces cyaneus]|uniref:hypothetical protein n=1 Tax=Streptomyces cyaneus TaxID=1904 RepID=UPI0013E2D00A|nr:hypothetical protein [Streptomyces cyaneus]
MSVCCLTASKSILPAELFQEAEPVGGGVAPAKVASAANPDVPSFTSTWSAYL